MIGKWKTAFCLVSALLGISTIICAQESRTEQVLKASLRKAGHELLLRSGDSTSLILPVEKKQDAFVLKFASEFQLDPEDLTQVISSEMKEIPDVLSYLVEVKTCGSGKLAYSSRFDDRYGEKEAACKGRILQKACYVILVTVFETKSSASKTHSLPNQGLKLIGFVIPASFGLGWIILKRKKQRKPSAASRDLISIGSFLFDPVQMKLLHTTGECELTGKEAELLSQLYLSVNQVVDRDVILRTVWGDEGDYIGRTLDVFISRLRKKLEADPAVRIINIRGIGYKLVIG